MDTKTPDLTADLTHSDSSEMKYTTYGQVRGQCGHAHQSEETARRCLQHDRTGCVMQGGYSDRDVYAVGADGYLYDGDMVVWPSHGQSCGAVRAECAAGDAR